MAVEQLWVLYQHWTAADCRKRRTRITRYPDRDSNEASPLQLTSSATSPSSALRMSFVFDKIISYMRKYRTTRVLRTAHIPFRLNYSLTDQSVLWTGYVLDIGLRFLAKQSPDTALSIGYRGYRPGRETDHPPAASFNAKNIPTGLRYAVLQYGEKFICTCVMCKMLLYQY